MPEIKTTVTFLEMRAEPRLHVPTPVNSKLMLMRAEKPSIGFYRFLYDAVGRSYHWIDRKQLDDAALATIIADSRVEIWVLYAAGQPAGFFEVNAIETPVVELGYFGLMPEFHGLGLGKWFLAEAIRACWARKPERVIVETCTLDGPAALPLYQKLGFAPYGRKEKMVDVSD
ncbi:MAG: GNAT family N-acetyltransferase [Rhizobiales bacterium]|nr:GNAT family N-acetyltransferase [Hyphomicrobiales bacterium]